MQEVPETVLEKVNSVGYQSELKRSGTPLPNQYESDDDKPNDFKVLVGRTHAYNTNNPSEKQINLSMPDHSMITEDLNNQDLINQHEPQIKTKLPAFAHLAANLDSSLVNDDEESKDERSPKNLKATPTKKRRTDSSPSHHDGSA